MTNFWDSNIWSLLLLGGMLFASMLIAHILKKNITFLQKSLIPASVLGGIIILIFTQAFRTNLLTYRTNIDIHLYNMYNYSNDLPLAEFCGDKRRGEVTS